MSRPWLLHDHAILRSTGFAWGLLDALDHPLTDAALAELDQAEAELGAAVTAVVAAARADPGAISPAQSRKLRKALSRRRDVSPDLLADVGNPALLAAVDSYRRRLAAVQAATQAAQRQLDDEAASSHAAILDTADTSAGAAGTAVREALWLSSPAMHDRGLAELAELGAEPSRGRARRLRRQLGGYLQRLAAKNETMSFFGPINYAEFGIEPDGSEPAVAGPARRSASLAYWAVVVLADAIAADPAIRPHLRPRASGLLTTTDPLTFGGVRLRLPPPLRELLRAADGSRSVPELARQLGRPAADVFAAVERAAERRLLLLDCRPPVTVPDALGWLRAFVAALPAGRHWLGVLDRICQLLDEFAAAGLERRRELLAELESEIAGRSPGPVRRGGGAWYADRLVVHEEALGNLSPLALGRALRDRLRERLSPALDLLAAEGVARHAALTGRFLDRHPELADGRPVPLLTLLRSGLPASQEPLSAPPGPLTAAGRWVAKLVDAADPDRPLQLDPAQLPDVDLGADPLIASPDLMFSATSLAGLLAGEGELVLAECHDTMLIWGWALQFHPRREQVQLAGAQLLRHACGSATMAVVLGSRRAKVVPFDFPGPVVDLGNTMPVADRPRVRIADVGVRLRGGRLVCAAPGRPDFLLHHGELDSDVHNVLAPPRVRPVTFGSARRTPRVVLGDVVLARARWLLDRDELFLPGAQLPAALPMLRHARRAAADNGIPRRCFLHVPGERKPVLLDLRAPALLDLGWQLSAQADRVVLTELLPGPEGLWLTGRQGRHCAELRTTLVLDRRPAALGELGGTG
jgi:Lantibiotic dehydratase, N terminus